MRKFIVKELDEADGFLGYDNGKWVIDEDELKNRIQSINRYYHGVEPSIDILTAPAPAPQPKKDIYVDGGMRHAPDAEYEAWVDEMPYAYMMQLNEETCKAWLRRMPKR